MDRAILDELNINNITKQLRSSSRSVKNRLQSILKDYEWIAAVQTAYDRPLVPNERCGLWYVPPAQRLETSYFKSTDGHTNEWDFSLRRLNLHLLPLIASHNGIILVDSTRRGKRIPDALSKTVPIWCAVINYVMMGPPEGESHTNWLHCPPGQVSKSEYTQIISRIPQFAQRATAMGILKPQQLAEMLSRRPLRPLWVFPDPKNAINLPETPPGVFDDFHPVICCTASKMCQDGIEMNYAYDKAGRAIDSWYYVQGAADDHELWAGKHLSPPLFWQVVADANFDINTLNDAEFLLNIEQLHSTNISQATTNSDDLTQALGILRVGDTCLDFGLILANLRLEAYQHSYKVAVCFSENFAIESAAGRCKVLNYPFQSSKKGSKQFRQELPQIMAQLESEVLANASILIVCDTGKDLSVGMVLVILCQYYNLDTVTLNKTKNEVVSKEYVKKWLARILEYKKVNPSRATLLSVNSYLM
ncbi:hypothetical protein BABINDRAFT_163649 [Babjeviella inositovora NRRL Y-12698]|uniref:Initiator tRNA phosphoribosyl transferase n=1 Tax=Babjeviella inositovora NRRL Y-12698 TaxID=984486 RepID=A0A1E3QJZ4_9ASCO|nr:uncharacterized protein BABINDRAFT_163649 [Babjeviella inositovora NRRL Y-12698]ODQ77402.1 hypothetical protein BABINDRAFT_163649 [Babjeviella inositovora NRRL Y-12698]